MFNFLTSFFKKSQKNITTIIMRHQNDHIQQLQADLDTLNRDRKMMEIDLYECKQRLFILTRQLLNTPEFRQNEEFTGYFREYLENCLAHASREV
jgi:hypothetical protein